jgi:hypothetical protein
VKLVSISFHVPVVRASWQGEAALTQMVSTLVSRTAAFLALPFRRRCWWLVGGRLGWACWLVGGDWLVCWLAGLAVLAA